MNKISLLLHIAREVQMYGLGQNRQYRYVRIDVATNDAVVLELICFFQASDWSGNTVVFAGPIRGLEKTYNISTTVSFVVTSILDSILFRSKLCPNGMS